MIFSDVLCYILGILDLSFIICSSANNPLSIKRKFILCLMIIFPSLAALFFFPEIVPVFVTIIVLIILPLYFLKQDKQLQAQYVLYNDLQSYTCQIEQLYQNIRGFKHDYINILTTMQQYIEDNNWPALTTYYYSEILPSRNLIQDDTMMLGRLSNLQIPELKSIYYKKYITAIEEGIHVELEIPSPVTKINAKHLDIARITGIYLDNAIEALRLESKAGGKRTLRSAIIDSEDAVTIIIENDCADFSLNIHQLGSANYSTKGINRGMGLYLASRLMQPYKNLQSTTNFEDRTFTQILKIYKE